MNQVSRDLDYLGVSRIQNLCQMNESGLLKHLCVKANCISFDLLCLSAILRLISFFNLMVLEVMQDVFYVSH